MRPAPITSCERFIGCSRHVRLISKGSSDRLGRGPDTQQAVRYDDGETHDMQVKMIIFPGEDGLDVVIWGKWTRGTMRHRHFDCRTSMIGMLESLRLIDAEEARKLESSTFFDYCPVYSAEIEEDVLAAHGFLPA